MFGGGAHHGSWAGSGHFRSGWVRSGSGDVGLFTTVKLD